MIPTWHTLNTACLSHTDSSQNRYPAHPSRTQPQLTSYPIRLLRHTDISHSNTPAWSAYTSHPPDSPRPRLKARIPAGRAVFNPGNEGSGLWQRGHQGPSTPRKPSATLCSRARNTAMAPKPFCQPWALLGASANEGSCAWPYVPAASPGLLPKPCWKGPGPCCKTGSYFAREVEELWVWLPPGRDLPGSPNVNGAPGTQ